MRRRGTPAPSARMLLDRNGHRRRSVPIRHHHQAARALFDFRGNVELRRDLLASRGDAHKAEIVVRQYKDVAGRGVGDPDERMARGHLNVVAVDVVLSGAIETLPGDLVRVAVRRSRTAKIRVLLSIYFQLPPTEKISGNWTLAAAALSA